MNAYRFSDISVSDCESFLFSIDERKMELFRQISGDENPLHTDSDFAEARGFHENVVYGQLTASALSSLAGMYLPGKYSVIHTVETHFLKPVFLSKCPLRVVGIVKEKDDRFGIIIVGFEMFDVDNTKVCKGKMRIGFTE